MSKQSTTDSATNRQVTYVLPGASGNFSFYGARASAAVAATQKTAAILVDPASGSRPEVLLEAVADTSRANTVSVSTNSPLWLPQQQLLERSDVSGSSFQAITATAAPKRSPAAGSDAVSFCCSVQLPPVCVNTYAAPA